ncbi:uncharacterized protein LAESUDRAFT_764600 [Laetiporus sulphureus 93-53]|uniref:DUF6534 domain-containing protein n=1 Tax=Laetiporus sulphureus 93-53 TaxID=1314785 RepID=A0A165B870_9APHY|nr:uncharacterized protein LAESUDRAFT_764600 [Laetiporus sulphureus 93-53]KZT00469.1 hypothetical protein LAESUDRAFT_764600 [Laetiporus sulphureus 93-53]
MLWYYAVDNFGSPKHLEDTPWPYVTTRLFVVLVSCPIQQFFAWRVKILGTSKPLFVISSTLSISGAALIVVDTIITLGSSESSRDMPDVDLTNVGLTIASACDLLIAFSLLYYLLKSRTGFKRTDNVILRLINTCVQTSLINAMVSSLDLAFFNAFKNANWCFIFAIPMGHVYTISLLALLTSRASLREKFGGITEINLPDTIASPFNLRQLFNNRIQPTEIRVAVEQRVELDDGTPCRRGTESPVKIKEMRKSGASTPDETDNYELSAP